MLFRIGTFLLWPTILAGIIALCVVVGKFMIEGGRAPDIIIIGMEPNFYVTQSPIVLASADEVDCALTGC